MENMDNGIPLLFINEEGAEPEREIVMKPDDNRAQPGLNFSGNPSALIRPYLQEMDELLKSCEELTGISFGTVYSESFAETSLNKTTSHARSTEDVLTESYRETIPSLQTYLCLATQMDEAETKEQEKEKSQEASLASCGQSRGGLDQTGLPVSEAGKKLSKAMLDYEGQLRGMLATLQGCVEETGMDFEAQEWNGDARQEYVHISKSTTVELEPQLMQFGACADQHEEGERFSKESRDKVTEIIGQQQQNSLLYSDNLGGILMDRVEESGQNKQAVSEPQLSVSAPLDLGRNTEGTKAVDMFDVESEEDVSRTGVEDMEMLSEETKVKAEVTELRADKNDLDELGSQMEECIQRVQHLEKRRRELLAEVLDLRGNTNREEKEQSAKGEEWTNEQMDGKVIELMKILRSEEEQRREERKKEFYMLREERAEEERRMWKVNLERMGLQEELRKLKRRLFTIMRESTHCQAILKNHCKEVELLKREEEKLQALVLQLTEECSQLRSAQNRQILELQTQLQSKLSSQTSCNQEELTECKRNSCGDIQQYLQEGLRFLENRYEPLLLALLKRRDATAGALVKAKEESQQLRSQLRPLRDEIQKLKLQRACLEEKLKLIYIHHKEEMGLYKETVCSLEERSRDLKTELQIQKRKNKDIEELRDSFKKQVLRYRATIQQQKEIEPEKQT